MGTKKYHKISIKIKLNYKRSRLDKLLLKNYQLQGIEKYLKTITFDKIELCLLTQELQEKIYSLHMNLHKIPLIKHFPDSVKEYFLLTMPLFAK